MESLFQAALPASFASCGAVRIISNSSGSAHRAAGHEQKVNRVAKQLLYGPFPIVIGRRMAMPLVGNFGHLHEQGDEVFRLAGPVARAGWLRNAEN